MTKKMADMTNNVKQTRIREQSLIKYIWDKDYLGVESLESCNAILTMVMAKYPNPSINPPLEMYQTKDKDEMWSARTNRLDLSIPNPTRIKQWK